MVGTLFLLFTRDTSNELTHSGNAAETLHEATFFFEHLKSDISNATFSFTDQNWKKMFSASNNTLMFTITGANPLSKEVIVYYYEKTSKGGNISRKVGNKSPQVIIKNRVADLSWKLITEEQKSEPWQCYKRLLIKIHLALVKNAKKAKQEQSQQITFDYYLTPTRLNRYINSRAF